MKTAPELYKDLLEENNLLAIPFISNADKTDAGKVILSAGIQVLYKKEPEKPEEKK